MIRKMVAAAILTTFAGALVEIEAAGPFGDIKWWRAPLTGGSIAGVACLLGWAETQLAREPAADKIGA